MSNTITMGTCNRCGGKGQFFENGCLHCLPKCENAHCKQQTQGVCHIDDPDCEDREK